MDLKKQIFFVLFWLAVIVSVNSQNIVEDSKPNIILVMSDDQGWGQTSYNGHPIVKTPSLDAMAEGGATLQRFYAAPVCSPTRATVLTGRSSARNNVHDHGYPMRMAEKTIAQALKSNGYKTAHFGKWHLSGLMGPGAPILKSNPRNPGVFGFDTWISCSNFFDLDPILGKQGKPKKYKGNSSEVAIELAMDYIRKNKDNPLFVVVWLGSPHRPHIPTDKDRSLVPDTMNQEKRNYLAEVVELDHSIGQLREELRELDLAQNTILWFNSDNGALDADGKDGTANLRGFKSELYEGGIRVPCTVEWPEKIKPGTRIHKPASTLDIFPTLLSLLNLSDDLITQPYDGHDISPYLFNQTTINERVIPILFRQGAAFIQENYKLVCPDIEAKNCELFDLSKDPQESYDLSSVEKEKTAELRAFMKEWLLSVKNSELGKDYSNNVKIDDPGPQRFWGELPEYRRYLRKWKKRPEYADWLD